MAVIAIERTNGKTWNEELEIGNDGKEKKTGIKFILTGILPDSCGYVWVTNETLSTINIGNYIFKRWIHLIMYEKLVSIYIIYIYL